MSDKNLAVDVVQEKDSSLYLVQKNVPNATDVLQDVEEIMNLKK